MEDWKHRPEFACLAELINEHDSFAIVAHIRPDADAIGSTLALGEALKDLGKSVVMLNEDDVPSNLSFLEGVEQIEKSDGFPLQVDVAVSVDNGSKKRLGDHCLRSLEHVKTWANIDHHQTNELFGDVTCVFPDECATGAVLYHFFRFMDLPITPIIRDALYAAISTDTGSFQYSKTSAEVMEIGADLIRKGVDVERINRCLYQEQTWEKIQLLREVLNGMELAHNGQICTFGLTNEAKKRCSCRPDDTEGLIDILRSVKGVVLAGYFEEIEDDPRIRVSLRSKNPKLSVADLAAKFGGGGHAMAAGVRIRGSLNEVRNLLIGEMEKLIDSL